MQHLLWAFAVLKHGPLTIGSPASARSVFQRVQLLSTILSYHLLEGQARAEWTGVHVRLAQIGFSYLLLFLHSQTDFLLGDSRFITPFLNLPILRLPTLYR